MSDTYASQRTMSLNYIIKVRVQMRLKCEFVRNTIPIYKPKICYVFLLLASLITLSFAALERESISNQGDEIHSVASGKATHFYNYDCFQSHDVFSDNLNLSQQKTIGIQVTQRATHQVMSRIFAIFLREVLNYRKVVLIPIDLPNFNYDEAGKNYYILDLIRYHSKWESIPMINLEVWMTPLEVYRMPVNIYEAGPSVFPGRFGWFVPKNLVSKDDNSTYSLHYDVFREPTNPYYNLYIMDVQLLNRFKSNKNIELYNSTRCSTRECATLIAEYRRDTAFVEKQIEETNSFLNILWMGPHFAETVKLLNNIYQNAESKKRFLLLHWTPSDIIDIEANYTQISMPRCEEFHSLINSTCKYELTPVLKYYQTGLENDVCLHHALRNFFMNDGALHSIYYDLNMQSKVYNSSEDRYNKVACNWLEKNKNVYRSWVIKQKRLTLSIGGIFPLNMTSRGHSNIVAAVQAAVSAINRNSSILSEYDLQVLKNNGQCKADMVMKAFIHYFNEPTVLGVLGPACSETVEPIAGISKHMSMAVISYSAEGSSFKDRSAYPYFFRTIGSNQQYEDVYIKLMNTLGWRRVAALTEDGQKYTEYISKMESSFKQRNLELIINKKFPSDVTVSQMKTHLSDLKNRSAKIIIADIHNRNAAMAMCEAKKLRMTSRDGYVWFLPFWLSKDWRSWQNILNNSCTEKDLKEACEGHFSIRHSPFGDPSSIMQEGITVKRWLEVNNNSLSNYAGFAYDAVWTYAIAADKLVQENKGVLDNLRLKSVVNRFVELVWQTDFEGLSGRVRFGEGGSRITALNILQWRQGKFFEVGRFDPEIVGSEKNMHPEGGTLSLNINDVSWGTETQPSDGKYDCSLSSLAELMHMNCDSAEMMFAISMCLLAVVVVSLISFLFWKRRYDSKLKRSTKIMKYLGIELLTNETIPLDKWEIPKKNVVINRRLGEGAFGTVYGGEAQIGSEDWTAVAVKTLKAGTSTADRLDFLAEAEAMKCFDNKNIIKLLAVCLQSEPIYTIMEFMLYGDLKTYLLARRNMVNEKTSDESDISPKRLTIYAMDVARGLAYLAERKYVHRDIACRNCLVNSQRVVKIGDFGMTRPTFESDYYRFNRKGMLPVRWMAPESLDFGVFTTASDIWSFGIVLYEIITFGSYPYQGLTNNQVIDYVIEGNTLEIPTGVKAHLEGLLKACWSKEIKKRPTASEVINYISNCPRLLTPCIDFPGTSVETPETESDQLELLPKARECSPLKRDSTLDILSQTSSSNKKYNTFIGDVNLLQNINCGESEVAVDLPLSSADFFPLITPEGYSIMSPDKSHSSQSHAAKPSQNEILQQTLF